MEWISSNWTAIAGSVVALLGGWYVPIFRKLYIIGLKAMLSEKMLKKVFMAVAQQVVKSTKNTLDDAWFEQFKSSVEKS
jgi:hypothetical protein